MCQYTRGSVFKFAQFAPGACSQIFNRLNIVEHFAGWKFCSRGWSIPMKSLVHTEELCSRRVPLEHAPGAKSLVVSVFKPLEQAINLSILWPICWNELYIVKEFAPIGYFRVPKTLTFRMRPSAQAFLWKWPLFAREWKIMGISKAETSEKQNEQNIGQRMKQKNLTKQIEHKSRTKNRKI